MTSKTYGPFLKSNREAKGYSQQQVADFLSISRTSYINIEQDKRELTLNEASILANLFNITLDDLIEEQSPNLEKYKAMLISFLKLNQKDGKIPKTKLAKLMYLADFAWYYQNLVSMSGMQYKKLEYGPVPDVYFRVVDEMFEKGEINIETKNDALLISLGRGADKKETSLTADELQLIGDIHKKWDKKRTKEIVDFTHSQMPWKFGRDGEVVHYELITQEDPDHVY